MIHQCRIDGLVSSLPLAPLSLPSSLRLSEFPVPPRPSLKQDEQSTISNNPQSTYCDRSLALSLSLFLPVSLHLCLSLSVPLSLSPSLPLASHSLSTSSIPVSIPFCPSPSIKQDQQSTISNNQQSNVVLMLQPECMIIICGCVQRCAFWYTYLLYFYSFDI